MKDCCSICRKDIETDDAAILVMGGYGNPRYICNECDGDLQEATTAREIADIASAMDRISKKMKNCDPDDKLTLRTVDEVMTASRDRAEKIKSGEYDFSLDEVGGEDEKIPEELLETEEDKAAEEAEEKKNAKLDKITNWVCLVILLAALGVIAYWVIKQYL